MAEDSSSVFIQMTEEQFRELEQRIERAVQRGLIESGISTESPIENQADFRFLRAMRTTHEAVKSKAILTIVGTVIVATLTLIVLGFSQWIHHGTPGK